MAHAKLVTAAKDYPEQGIKKGEKYYWWKFRRGGKHYSKTAPRPSQLTQSDFLSQAYAIGEEMEKIGLVGGELSGDELAAAVSDAEAQRDDFAEQIRTLGEEQGDKLSNMPDSLQEGPTGELLQSRVDSCDEWADQVEGVDFGDDMGGLNDGLGELSGMAYEGE